MSLRQAIKNTPDAKTANGAATFSTSLNACVDFFFLAGSSRGKDITAVFRKAFLENEDVAIRILLWLRDVRGGSGERETFRNLFRDIAENDYKLAVRILKRIPDVGRWDDVLVAMGTPAQPEAVKMVHAALQSKDGLCAKWMPREVKKVDGKTFIRENAKQLRQALGMNSKVYRKTLAGLSNTVEDKMTSKQWSDIEFSHVPSLAAARYQKAFMRNAPRAYQAYVDSLVKGETKINAAAVYPYDVLRSARSGNPTVANQQWKSLPDYLEGTEENILPMVDVSGSMGCRIGENLTALDVAISLGIYLAERLQGDFKDHFMTFSSSPALVKLSGAGLLERFRKMDKSTWDMSTDLQKAFSTILEAAVKHKVPVSEMPTQILILSDMEFNSCVRNRNSTNYKAISGKYKAAGYKLPKIVFWNLNGRVGNNPVRYDQSGTAMVSGFSPAIMGSVLGCEDFTPEAVMLKTVMVDRYQF